MLKLSEIAHVYSGIALRPSAEGPARYIRLSDLSELRQGRRPALANGESPSVGRAFPITVGDLLVGARGAITEAYVGDANVVGAFVSLDLFLVRPNLDLVDPHFLETYLGLPSTQAILTSGKQGSSLSRLSKEALEKLPVPLPPMATQKTIVGLAAAIRNKRALLMELVNLVEVLGREAIADALKNANSTSVARLKGTAR